MLIDKLLMTGFILTSVSSAFQVAYAHWLWSLDMSTAKCTTGSASEG